MDVMQVNIMKKLESDAAMNSGGKKGDRVQCVTKRSQKTLQ